MFLLDIIRLEKAFQSCLFITSLSHAQCCQNGPKNRPLSKQFGPFVKIATLIPFHQNMTKILKPYQYQNLWKFQVFYVSYEKNTGTKHLKNSASFRLFWENAAKILPQIFTAAYIFYFYSAPFEIYGRRIGQLGTLGPSSSARRPPWRPIRKIWEPRAMEGGDGIGGKPRKVLYCRLRSYNPMIPWLETE